jgi:NAD(P)-dependent dehydrogenase (short-subunit alcohol dehydrogenase family)
MSQSQPAGKTVLVTGVSSGIGKAIATELARQGFRVFGSSRSGAAVDGLNVEMIAMDVDRDVSVAAGVASVIARAGRLDAVVNNAGWALMGPVEETSIDEARAQFETNFFGVFRVCRAALPTLRAQAGGHIVNIGSLAGVVGAPFSGLYSASKFAVEGLTEALRFEMRGSGVAIVLVEPGDTDTSLPKNRRTVAGASPASPYAQRFAKYQAAQAKDEAKAIPPQAVAKVVAAALQTATPRMRYVVANPGQGIVVPLKRFLPFSLFERIVGAAMGV